ncbi:unnamed protein product [Brachionus calyciflorus]|uniref:G-protein coupled receptors family 1 profile domain-containing protein n=1 Tax=Brachionus calyciflorus TaxID=104777 RepID=A0A813S818_9BILA|nr:unnamed protein product [Brachionus calyciflorus]
MNQTLDELYFLRKVELFYRNVFFYVNLSIVPIGLILNSISLVIFMSKRFNKAYFRNYYILITLFDMLTLLAFFIHLFPIGINIDLHLTSNLNCKLTNYYLRIISKMSIWINVILTVDALIKLKYPKNELFQKKHTLTFLVLGLFLIFHIVNLVNLWFRVEMSKMSGSEVLVCTTSPKLLLIRDFLSQMFRIHLPYFLIYILNMFLMKHLRKFKQRYVFKNKFFSILKMNFFYCFNASPIAVCLIIAKFSNNNAYFKGTMYILYALASSWNLFNHSFSFFMNLKYNWVFRRQFYDLVSRLRRKNSFQLANIQIKFYKVNF